MTKTALPIRSDVKKITYSRKPTASEIKFGYGATHYLDFSKEQCLKADGSIKKRITGGDGLVYTR